MLSQINEQKTAANVAAVLKTYAPRRAMTRRAQFAALRSPSMDGMPHASNPHALEDSIIGTMDNAMFVKQCNDVLAAMEDEDHRHILQWLYFTRPALSNQMVQGRIDLSERTYYRYKRQALIEFAELWPPKPHELVAWK